MGGFIFIWLYRFCFAMVLLEASPFQRRQQKEVDKWKTVVGCWFS